MGIHVNEKRYLEKNGKGIPSLLSIILRKIFFCFLALQQGTFDRADF